MTIDPIVYFGTPEFAVPALRSLVEAQRAPLLVVTQPPRRSGHGMRLHPSPVAEVAAELNLPLAEVSSVRERAFMDQLGELQPDLAVVAAFGQIFRAELLQLPRLGCLNIHASLLPKYRGAAPIQAAIAAGDRETGVSMMWMEQGLDTGPVVAQYHLPIGDAETAPSLSARLAELGAKHLPATVGLIEQHLASGDSRPGQAQDERLSSYARQLRRDDGMVDWSTSASALYNRWRAYQPWPGLFVEHGGETIKLTKVAADESDVQHQPGTLVAVEADRLVVACGKGHLIVATARRAGRGEVSGRDLANGLRLRPGHRVGEILTRGEDRREP